MASRAAEWANTARQRPHFDAPGLHARISDVGTLEVVMPAAGIVPDEKAWCSFARWVLDTLLDSTAGASDCHNIGNPS